MSSMIKIAVDAMGGDNSPKKVIDGIIHHYLKNKDIFYKIFGDEQKIISYIENKIDKQNYQIVSQEISEIPKEQLPIQIVWKNWKY